MIYKIIALILLTYYIPAKAEQTEQASDEKIEVIGGRIS